MKAGAGFSGKVVNLTARYIKEEGRIRITRSMTKGNGQETAMIPTTLEQFVKENDHLADMVPSSYHLIQTDTKANFFPIRCDTCCRCK